MAIRFHGGWLLTLLAASALLQQQGVFGLQAERRSFDSSPDRPWFPAVLVYVYESPSWLEKCDYDEAGKMLNLPDIGVHYKLAKHPFRTYDPSEADLFFVPAYLSLSHVGRCGDHRENMKEIAHMLDQSPQFKKSNGRDHVISAFEFDLNPKIVGVMDTYMAEMIVLRFETGEHGHFARTVPIPYGGTSLRLMEKVLGERSHISFNMRAHTLFFMGQADVRYSYNLRRSALEALSGGHSDSVLITARNPRSHYKDPELPECVNTSGWAGCKHHWDLDDYARLARNSKFFLVMHGDSPSTNRLYDALQFESIPIIISNGFKDSSMVFPEDVFWQKFAFFVDEQEFAADPVGVVKQITSISEEEIRNRLTELSKARKLLVWSSPGNCMGTALIKHLARNFLGKTSLRAAYWEAECDPEEPLGSRFLRQVPYPRASTPPGFPHQFVNFFEHDTFRARFRTRYPSGDTLRRIQDHPFLSKPL